MPNSPWTNWGYGAARTLGVNDVYPGMVSNAAAPNSQQFSGPNVSGGPQPQHILLGIVLALVAIRVLYERAS